MKGPTEFEPHRHARRLEKLEEVGREGWQWLNLPEEPHATSHSVSTCERPLRVDEQHVTTSRKC